MKRSQQKRVTKQTVALAYMRRKAGLSAQALGDFCGCSRSAIMHYENGFLRKANESSKRKIRMLDVLDFAVEKLGERDIPKIQERVHTADDKMELMLEDYNKRNADKPMTREQFKAALVDAFEKQVLNKLVRAQKPEPDVRTSD